MEMGIPKTALISVEIVDDNNGGIFLEVTDETGASFDVCGINCEGDFWTDETELERIGLNY